jgi:hypothetical protein
MPEHALPMLEAGQEGKMTPLAIEMILHFHITREPYPNSHCGPQQEILKEFLDRGLIEFPLDIGQYRTTEKGAAWVEMICATPYPVIRFVDPRFEK